MLIPVCDPPGFFLRAGEWPPLISYGQRSLVNRKTMRSSGCLKVGPRACAGFEYDTL